MVSKWLHSLRSAGETCFSYYFGLTQCDTGEGYESKPQAWYATLEWEITKTLSYNIIIPVRKVTLGKWVAGDSKGQTWSQSALWWSYYWPKWQRWPHCCDDLSVVITSLLWWPHCCDDLSVVITSLSWWPQCCFSEKSFYWLTYDRAGCISPGPSPSLGQGLVRELVFMNTLLYVPGSVLKGGRICHHKICHFGIRIIEQRYLKKQLVKGTPPRSRWNSCVKDALPIIYQEEKFLFFLRILFIYV